MLPPTGLFVALVRFVTPGAVCLARHGVQLRPGDKKRQNRFEAQFLISSPPLSTGHYIEFSIRFTTQLCFVALVLYFSRKVEPGFLN